MVRCEMQGANGSFASSRNGDIFHLKNRIGAELGQKLF